MWSRASVVLLKLWGIWCINMLVDSGHSEFPPPTTKTPCPPLIKTYRLAYREHLMYGGGGVSISGAGRIRCRGQGSRMYLVGRVLI